MQTSKPAPPDYPAPVRGRGSAASGTTGVDATGPGAITVPPRIGTAVLAAVRDSCLEVADRPVRLAEAFYSHLFDIAPQTRAMFPANMSDQMQKMTDMLLAAVAGLDDADTTVLAASMRDLGAHHRRYLQVESEHYGYIGHALTRAVRDVSGSRWTGALSSSWVAVIEWITTQMLAGADSVDP